MILTTVLNSNKKLTYLCGCVYFQLISAFSDLRMHFTYSLYNFQVSANYVVKFRKHKNQLLNQIRYIANPQQQRKSKMARKTSRKSPVVARIKRTSSMEKCIADAQSFILPPKAKKIFKTRTMARTIEEAARIVNPKINSKKTKKSVKAAPVKTKAAGKKASPRPVRPAVPSMPATTGTKIFRARSIDRSLHPAKATIFKTSSRDNLPLPAFGFIDVCFCIDATGSMQSELAQVQSTIVEIINKIQNKVRTEGITLRFAIVTYRDHPPQQSSYVTEYQNFTDAHEAITYVNKLNAAGGGDEPEAVHDGLIDACQKLNWVEMPGTPMLRYIFHIADAPPHGKEFLNPESHEGCLCGKKTEQIIHEINIRQIHYRLIKVRSNAKVDEMQKIFKKGIVDFDSAQIVNAKEMDIRVSDMIIHEILPQA